MKAMAYTAIAAIVTALASAIVAPAAMAQQKAAAPDNLHYEIYQPSQRLRTRRDNCSSDEDIRGAYCVKKCDTSYVAFGNGHPPRCRSIEPLPPGVMPSAMRVRTGAQPLPPVQQHPNKQ